MNRLSQGREDCAQPVSWQKLTWQARRSARRSARSPLCSRQGRVRSLDDATPQGFQATKASEAAAQKFDGQVFNARSSATGLHHGRYGQGRDVNVAYGPSPGLTYHLTVPVKRLHVRNTAGLTVTAASAWNRGDDAGGLVCRGPLAGGAPA